MKDLAIPNIYNKKYDITTRKTGKTNGITWTDKFQSVKSINIDEYTHFVDKCGLIVVAVSFGMGPS